MLEEVAGQEGSPPQEAPAAPAAASPPAPILHLLLAIPADIAERLPRQPLFRAVPRRPTTRHVHEVYWDAPDHALGRAGWALGERKAGRRRSQFLRDLATAPAAGRRITQYEARLDAPRVEPLRFAFAAGLDPALAGRLAGGPLVPLFALDRSRQTWRITQDGATVAVTIEATTIEWVAGKQVLHQVELAHVEGGPAAFYEAARSIGGALDLRLAPRDPAQEGYRLVTGKDWWRPGGLPELQPEMSVREGILAIGRAAAADLRAELACLAGRLDVDGVHQARVALRRLRSILTVFRDALPEAFRRSLGKDLAALASALGPVREWDVFRLETLEPLRAALSEVPADRLQLDRLMAAVGREREAAATRACEVLGATNVLPLLLRLGAWFDAGLWPALEAAELARLDEPVGTFARRLLRNRYRRLKRDGARAKGLATAELHGLRIDAKKQRYALEFLRPLFPARATKAHIEDLKALQELLGIMNDAVVARRLIADAATSAGDAAWAEGLVSGWAAARIAEAKAQLPKMLARLGGAKRFWGEE